MTTRTKRLFSAKFKLEAAQRVLDQNYSVTEAAQTMNMDKSTMDKWGSLARRRASREST